MPGTDRTDQTNEFAGRLNDWLDRLVIDAPPADAGIDPVSVATVERFFARDDAPPPPPDLADQVWNSIMRGSSAMPHGSDALVVTRSNGNGRHSVARQAIPVSVWTGPAPVAGRTSRATSGARRWGAGFAQATSILLLVLTLGLGYLALMLGTGSNRGPGAILPAPTHPSVDMANAETLMTLSLPSESLPNARAVRVAPVEFTVQPGTSGRWLGAGTTCCSGVRVDHVVAGSYTVRADGPIQARWADGRTETVKAGTEIVLGPGDGMTVPEGTAFDNANTGSDPVRVVGWYLYEGAGKSHRTAPNWWNDSSWETFADLPPLTGAVTLRMQRVWLAPGTAIQPTGDAVQFVLSPDESAMLGQQSDGSVRNVGKTDFTAFILTATATQSDPVSESPVPDAASSSLQTEADGAAPLFSLTLTSDLFPADVWESAVLVNATIPPHTQGAWPGMESPCCAGVRIDYVAQGNVTIRAEDGVQVVWADGRLESIPAGREFALGPGDTLITPRDIPFVNANSGDEPVRLIGWILETGEPWQTEVSNWHEDSSVNFPVIGELPADPEAITFTLRRMEIPAGGDVPATPGALRFVASLDPSAMLGERSDGTVRNVGGTTATAYVLTMEPATAP